MTTVTCQHSRIEFESKSGRAKNHPAIDPLLKDAYRQNRYGETMDALKAVRKSGGYSTIEEYVALVNERIDAAVAKRREVAEKRRQDEVEAEKAAQETRRRREAENVLLREHGFKWIGDWGMDNFDEYEEPSGRPPTHWYLYAPDGKEIDVAVALQVARGETTLEAVRAAEADQAAAEAESKATAEREEKAEREREREARRQVETVEVERFDYRDFECIYSHGNLSIYAGEVNGVPAGAVTRHTYDDDMYWHYCADPEAAGLKRIESPEPGTFAATFRDFWK